MQWERVELIDTGNPIKHLPEKNCHSTLHFIDDLLMYAMPLVGDKAAATTDEHRQRQRFVPLVVAEHNGAKLFIFFGLSSRSKQPAGDVARKKAYAS